MNHSEVLRDIVDRWNIREVYHFTSGKNLNSIRENGGLLSLAEQKRLGIRCTEYLTDSWSRDRDVKQQLDDFVRLAFVRDHSMLDDVFSRIGTRRVACLRISPEVLFVPEVMFCREFAFQKGQQRFQVHLLEQELDLNVVYGTGHRQKDMPYWTRGKARRAEILIPGKVDLRYIIGCDWTS